MADWTPEEKRKRIAWSVASSCTAATSESPLEIYERLLRKFKEIDKQGHMVSDESNGSK